MAIETVPTVAAVPTPLIQRGDRATFSDRLDTFIQWLQGAPVDFKELGDNVLHNAQEAFTLAAAAASSATAASGSATAAAGSATAASGSATAAGGSATAASSSATAAAGSATAAASSAAGLTATSSSSVAIGTGTKVFTVPAGKQFPVNVPVIAVDTSNPANFIAGTVASYTGTTLTITSTHTGGSGTIAAWTVSVTGARGAQGPTGGTAGGDLVAALNEKKGTDVASVATLDIWSAGGNYVSLTGTTAITSFSAAPQAGARRTLLATAATPITASSNLLIKGVSGNGTYVVAAGDEIDVIAETTTKFRVTVRRGDGAPIDPLNGSYQNLRQFTSSGVFVARKTGWHRITATGSGGTGGAALQAGAGVGATGGGAGGFAVAMRYLTVGQSCIITVGGAVAGVVQSTTGSKPGNAGNASSFSGSGLVTVTANGGGAGQGTSTAGVALAGGVGGTAAGGEINVPGGDGGSIVAMLAGVTAATGGGAVGLQGQSYAGGSITTLSATGQAATGGGGVGGAGGNAALTSVGVAISAGGGAGGAASNVTNTADTAGGGANYAGVTGGPSAPAGYFSTLVNATGGGFPVAAQGGADAQNGGGGNGMQDTTVTPSGAAGALAGSGGRTRAGSSAFAASAAGAFGGGSGGAAQGGSGAATSGAGASGVIWIEF